MAKLDSLFEKFLSNINPDSGATAYAIEAHEPVREFLENDEDFGKYFVDSFLYGSYKRHTAVGTIKDVDIVILTNFDPDSDEDTPAKVLRKLKSALARHYDDPENPEYQRRSIRINRPLPNKNGYEITLDIIPAVLVNGDDEPLKVPDRESKEWIWSHPKGHIKRSSDLNKEENTEGRFVPLVKIFKWWWKYQCTVRQPNVERPKPKGFWVEVLTGENLDTSQHFYADHFIAVLENVFVKYSGLGRVPDLGDPGIPDEYVKTNMSLDEFDIFMQAITECLELAKQARDEPDNIKSSEIWQSIFGKEKFPRYSDDIQETKALTIPLDDASHAIRPEWPPIFGSRYKVSIRASICDAIKKFDRPLRNDGEILGPNELIKFFAETDVKGDFTIYWQVVNTGKHARSEGGLRGDKFFRGTNSDKKTLTTNQKVNFETTKYTGKHWVQCFVIQKDKYVAKSDKFFVNIQNPEFRN